MSRTGRNDLGDLAAFAVVAEEQSFTRAASKLGVSQSALSHAMRALEERLGLRLLARTTRSVSPTEAGQRLLATLRPALDEISGGLAALREMREKPSGLVRINASRHAAHTVLWPAISRFLSAYPDIQVEITVDDGLADIVANRFDAGVRLGERVQKDMIAVRIGPELRMAVVASPAYFEKRPLPRVPQDLTAHDCINRRMPTSGGLYAWDFEKKGKPLKVRVSGSLIFSDNALTLRAALDGRGLGYVMEDEVAKHVAEERLIRVLEDWCRPFPGYFMYYPSRRHTPPALAALVEALRCKP
jgi:DNA-binding transcriptional LysR family regulator